MADIRKHLESTLSGNRNAFAEVVAAYRDMAMAVAGRRLDNKSLAEEAVQEAFLSAYLNLSRLKNLESFGAWLRTILNRRCSNILRKEMSSGMSVDEQDIADNESLDPYEIFTHYLDHSKIQKIIEGLSGPCREAFILRYIHGRPYREIAETLGVPLGTVKRRLHETRDKVIREFNKKDNLVIRVGHLPISDHLLAMVAHQRQDPKQYNLQLKRFLSWGKLTENLKNATLDAAFVMAPLAMALYNAGLDIRYVLDGHHDGSAVTVGPGTNWRLNHGSRMALPHALSTHRLFLNRLLGAGGRNDDGGSKNLFTPFINPSYVINSLLKKEIDGFFCSEPWSSKSAAQGAGRILARSGDFAPGHICCILVVRNDFIEAQPELLRRFIRSLSTAGDFITSHPWEGAAIQARYTGIDRSVVQHILSKRYITYQDLTPSVGRAEQLAEMALEAGVLDRPCDLKRFVLRDFAS